MSAYTKPCAVPGHPHFLSLYRVQLGQPTTVRLCAQPADVAEPPGDGLFYLWSQAEADVWDLLDEERLAHPVARLTPAEWTALAGLARVIT